MPFKPVGFDKVIADAKDTNGNYIAQRLTLVGMIVRTDKVEAADYPKTWTDLTNSEIQGHAGDGRSVVHGDPARGGGDAVAKARLAVLRRRCARTTRMIVQGHEQIFDMVKRGERLVSRRKRPTRASIPAA